VFCEASFPVAAEAQPALVELQESLSDCVAEHLDPGAQI
jgi:hypothetical protein